MEYDGYPQLKWYQNYPQKWVVGSGEVSLETKEGTWTEIGVTEVAVEIVPYLPQNPPETKIPYNERPEVKLLGQMGLTQVRVCCPACLTEENIWGMPQIIIHLNDSHKWTREDIADWLELESERQGFSIELTTE